MLKIRQIALVLSAVVFAGALVGCSASIPKGSPQAAVQSLLQLRSQLATDPAAYSSYVETSLAEALATDSASRTATDAPIPKWDTPKLTSEESSTAKVTVRWKSSTQFANWAKATVFVLEKSGGKWRVIDASDASSSKSATSTP